MILKYILYGSIWSKFMRRIQKVDFLHCSSQGRPTCGPNKTRTKSLRIIGSFDHFPSGFGRRWPLNDSEQRFGTAPNPNPAHVLIRSRYLFWSLDPRQFLAKVSRIQEKIVLLGHFLISLLGFIMFLGEGVVWSLDFFWGILFWILFQH
jgi:hypothetical protein